MAFMKERLKSYNRDQEGSTFKHFYEKLPQRDRLKTLGGTTDLSKLCYLHFILSADFGSSRFNKHENAKVTVTLVNLIVGEGGLIMFHGWKKWIAKKLVPGQ